MYVVDGLLQGFVTAVSPEVLPYLIVGAIVGLIIGIIPGLSGHFAMAMMIPFVFRMDAAVGITFILAAHAAVAQGGGVTAILFATPGTGQNAATLLDGPGNDGKRRGRQSSRGSHDRLLPGGLLWGVRTYHPASDLEAGRPAVRPAGVLYACGAGSYVHRGSGYQGKHE